MSPVEKQHTTEAFTYQLGKVVSESVRQQNVDLLVNVVQELATVVADSIGDYWTAIYCDSCKQ